jgi:membrane protein DedA with SNARE-associated domain/membrane-associated phospholipid phosphatase
MDYIQPYLDYFTANPGWAIAIIFLIAMGEALLIIGLFVPSTAVLVGAGILVGTGHLGFWPVFIATAFGAIIGDQFSYWAGRLFGERLKTLWPLSRYPQLVAKGEDFVRLHGGKSIAIGRFVPGVKSVVPGIVGMFNMNQLFFIFVNVTSGTVWAAAHVFPGILIGEGLAFAGELSGRLVVVLLVLLVLIAVVGYAIRLIAAGVSPHLNRLLARISNWAKQRKGRSWRRFAKAVAPENPRSVLIVLFAAIIVASLTALGNLAIRATSAGAVSNMDISMFTLMREMRNAPADEIMIVLTMLGDSIVMAMLSVTIIAWLVWRKAYRAAMAASIAIVSAKLFEILVKFGIQRPRPMELAYNGAEFFGFPSGHATMAAVIFGILAVLVSHSMGRWGRALVYGACAASVVAIGYSRIYLGAHWLSDVLAGLLFGTVIAAAFGVAIEAIPPRRIKPLGLFGAAFIVFILAGAAHVTTGFGKAEEMYAMPQRQILVPVSDWVSRAWEQLPPRRIDLAGKPEEIFVAQYAGELDLLSQYLQQAGWAESPRWTWRASLPYLNPNSALMDLAPRPALHEGLKAKLTLTRTPADTPEQREVVRIYKTDLATADGVAYKPIYLLSLTREVRSNGFHLYAIPSLRAASATDVTSLRDALVQSKSFSRLAQHERAGNIQDLITAIP